jgi:hypothetical protein
MDDGTDGWKVSRKMDDGTDAWMESFTKKDHDVL